MQIHTLNQHNTKFWISDEVYADFSVDWFDHVNLSQKQIESTSAGRQPVIRVTNNETLMILRHYYRGGLPAKLSKDLFLYTGFKHSRPYREIQLLNTMRQANLPVPKPIAARCVRHGMSYSADIMLEEIVHAQTLVERLCAEGLQENMWQKIGATIKRFHVSGIEHVDLNANNILINAQDDIYLIDFDRCKQRDYHTAWASRGIDRLKRSLNKEKTRHADMSYEASLFDFLKRGYEA